MLQDFLQASYDKLASGAAVRAIIILVAASLALVLRATLHVIHTTPAAAGFPLFTFVAFVVVGLLFVAESVSIFDYYNTKHGWFPGFKPRS